MNVAVAVVLVPAAPAPQPLPDLRDLTGQPCTLPVSEARQGCPDEDRHPLVSCVLPVAGPGLRAAVEPDCPDWEPAPEGRTVPVTP